MHSSISPLGNYLSGKPLIFSIHSSFGRLVHRSICSVVTNRIIPSDLIKSKLPSQVLVQTTNHSHAMRTCRYFSNYAYPFSGLRPTSYSHSHFIRKETRYTEQHEWIKFEPNNCLVSMGLTPFLVSQIAKIHDIKFPKIGDQCERVWSRSNPIAKVFADKRSIPMFSHLLGTVVEINEKLRDHPQLLLESPEREWVFKVREKDLSANDETVGLLFDGEQYRKWQDHYRKLGTTHCDEDRSIPHPYITRPVNEAEIRYGSNMWIKLEEGTNLAYVGMHLDYKRAENISTLLCLFDFPHVGKQVKANEPIAKITWLEMFSGEEILFHSPVAGKVIEVNQRWNIDSLARSPKRHGWLYKMEVDSPEIVNLLPQSLTHQSLSKLRKNKIVTFFPDWNRASIKFKENNLVDVGGLGGWFDCSFDDISVYRVVLPAVGKRIEKGGTIAMMEWDYPGHRLTTPVSGIVTKVNEQLRKNPNLIKQRLEEGGWLCEMLLLDGNAAIPNWRLK